MLKWLVVMKYTGIKHLDFPTVSYLSYTRA
jgi:hypothetical protein